MPKSAKAVRGLIPQALLWSLAVIPLFYLLSSSKLPPISFPAPSSAPARCPDHRYSVEIISHDPLMIYVNNFLSEKEINWLLNEGESRYQRMLTYQGNSLSDKAVPDEGRTSYSAYLDKSDPVMACIGARALDFQGGMQRALGDYGNPQLVRYEPQQKVNLHYDWWDEPQNRGGRLYNRRTTILAYLEDSCTGGETYFPLIRAMNDRKESGDELLAAAVLLN
ncbi:hypothetical protein BDV26DRAFT_284900 [Aspergillus bertholletiae]|uniref:Prolyl 4-hydroxylase alpha subunit domain-containing protein n=1 Tax=Aspergillus bertholletiae TaxID=1226010 RepID=A0A5N7AXF9_9EURO|nr:hypothetical protein BDV26DRAFT_284900 [Aspergillus bertholletiae]